MSVDKSKAERGTAIMEDVREPAAISAIASLNLLNTVRSLPSNGIVDLAFLRLLFPGFP